jgi:mRNA interferase MazF
MPYEFGRIVLVPFPYTDQRASKKRPAMIASSRVYNDAKRDVIVMAITSQLRPSAGLGEVWIREWQAAKLLKPSAVKPVFATLEQRLILRRLGALQADDEASLRRAIFAVLG